jgi:hypothetical protein
LMAFKLRLIVDEYQLQRVVEEFANSVLPLEVRQVRINAAADASEASGPRRGSRDRLANSLPSAGGVSHNSTLEIDGVAYLINPPDRVKLGLPATVEPPAGANPSAPGTAAIETPAPTAQTDVAATTGATVPAAAAATPQTTGAADTTPPAK